MEDIKHLLDEGPAAGAQDTEESAEIETQVDPPENRVAGSNSETTKSVTQEVGGGSSAGDEFSHSLITLGIAYLPMTRSDDRRKVLIGVSNKEIAPIIKVVHEEDIGPLPEVLATLLEELKLSMARNKKNPEVTIQEDTSPEVKPSAPAKPGKKNISRPGKPAPKSAAMTANARPEVMRPSLPEGAPPLSQLFMFGDA